MGDIDSDGGNFHGLNGELAPQRGDAGRLSEFSFRAIFDATPDAIMVVRISMPPGGNSRLAPTVVEPTGGAPIPRGGYGGHFIDVNLGFEKHFGFTRNEVINKRFGELNIWIDAEARTQFVRELMTHGAVHNMETELRAKDGSPIPSLVSASLVEAGGENYVVGVVRNVSELKEAQRKLQESEATLRRIFDANLDSMTIVDLHEGRFVDVNEEFVKSTGYSRDEIIGKRSRDYDRYVNPGDNLRLVEELRRNGEIRNMEVLFRRKSGKIDPTLLSATLLELHGHMCCLTVTRDISALKEAEHQLIEAREAALAASRAKSEFLSSMSHEIRTPMNAVLGMADLLAETRLDGDQRKFLNIMINNGNALLELINGILDLAKIETGRFELEQTAFDVTELADHVCDTLAVRAHAKHLELACRVAPGLPAGLVGDPLRLRQILINLVGNAIKFTEAG